MHAIQANLVNQNTHIVKLMYFAALAIGLLLVAPSASGQSYQRGYQNQSSDYVIIYEDCDFRGNAREVDPGEYASLKSLKIKNDSISSIQVPPGVQVTLYENDRFGGEYATVTRDVRCLDRRWNDRASSLVVRGSNNNRYGYDNNSRSGGQYDSRSNNSRSNTGYDNRGRERGSDRYDNRQDTRRGSREDRYADRNEQYPNRSRTNNSRRNDNYANGYGYPQVQAIKMEGLSKVFFASTVLEKTGNKQWRIVNNNGVADIYRELNRDSRTIFLQNTSTRQRVQIGAVTKELTFVTKRGQPVVYPILRTENERAANRNRRDTNSDRGVIQNRCFTYKAYTRGGQGGIRFHGHDGFNQFTKRPHTGKLCHDGALTMEINKTSPGTNVVVEIEGKAYRFAANEKADVFKNTWYRKKVNLTVRGR